MPKRLDRYEFIWKAIQVHGYKDDLREIDYKNSNTKIKIICPIHGEYWINSYNYLRNHRCQKCGSNKLTLDEVIRRSIEMNGDKFDYSLIEDYKNVDSMIKLKCNVCGHIFKQKAASHLAGKGCPHCAGKNITTEEFIERLKKIHKDKYDYSKIVYVNTDTPVELICPIHGSVFVTPHSLLRGRGCPACGILKGHSSRRMSLDEFIRRAIECHHNENGKPLYDYSKVEYVNARTPVCIICPEHGKFWQKPYLHLQSKGCHFCHKKSKIELVVKDLLTNNNFTFSHQVKFDWLGDKSLDFFIEDLNIAIECHGLQHFKPIKYYGGEESFKKQVHRDTEKFKLCQEHNIKILYFTNQKQIKDYSLGKLIYNTDDLLKEIQSYANHK